MNTATHWTGVWLAVALAGSRCEAQSIVRASLDSTGAQANSGSDYAVISADGRFVAFRSLASNLVAGDTNGFYDIFVRDLLNGTTERVSVDSSGVEGDGLSGYPEPASISADGRFVAFQSFATNLVAADTNGQMGDIFVHDRQLGTTELVSVSSGGAAANGASYGPSISADGRLVAFHTNASNLVAGDTNGLSDVFVHDRQLGTTERVSVATGGAQGNGGCDELAISADGRFVTFESVASNLVAGDTNATADIFVRDLQAGRTECASIGLGGTASNNSSLYPSISADGRFVAFQSHAWNLVPGDTFGFWDVFVRDRSSGTTERVSVATGGVQANAGSTLPSISADGRCVAFVSNASNLWPGDQPQHSDVYLRDRQAGTTERVSSSLGGSAGNGVSSWCSASASGRFVVFMSHSTNLVVGDSNGVIDVFVRDRGDPPPPTRFCSGDGSSGLCPCGNNSAPGFGCENSAATGGAILAAAGSWALSNDTLLLTSSGELPSALSILLQGDAAIVAVHFGDGLRCTGGGLKRLYTRNASAGVVGFPQPGDPSISARSAALGDPIAAGTARYYQAYYRDPAPGFCPGPSGDTWNVSSALAVAWVP